MTHAYEHAIRAFDMDEGLIMYIGGDLTGRLLELGVITSEDGTDVIIHAMPARRRFMR